jgi:DUF1365 family protein
MQSCLYFGRVRHRRFAPRPHRFSYGLHMVLLDLAELDQVFRGRWLWSARRPALAWFRRADHFGDPAQPLDEAVRDLVERETGARPRGAIRLLTHLRYFGHCFNPVSFFYCHAPDGGVEAIVAEVNNTPWGERHCYVLSGNRRFRFEKRFHVSPFHPMEIDYDWRFSTPGERLAVHMILSKQGERVFDATLALERRPLTGRMFDATLARALATHPFMTLEVLGAIYFEALRLWIKRTPFHPHPA